MRNATKSKGNSKGINNRKCATWFLRSRKRMMRVVGSCDHSDRQFAGLVLMYVIMYGWIFEGRNWIETHPYICKSEINPKEFH